MAFSLVKKLRALNERDPANRCVEVILLSRNNADTGLRIFNSINHHNFNIGRAAFTRGERAHPYISAFGAQLFLSAESSDVRKALAAGFATVRILPSTDPVAGLVPRNCESLLAAMQFCFRMSPNASTSNKG